MDDESLTKLMREMLGSAVGDGRLSPNQIGIAAGGDPAGPKPAWRALLRQIERVAVVLEAEGTLVSLRKGKPVPLAEARGVIRYAAAPGATPTSGA
ncbi:DUF3253 domain-containing protein [uncultured Nisaea sp.]|uniref:DUF3253 domain-containing protein n=1 Tax=uncultured Nisaea sp. TaxID=538215 RepID=UPI0030EC780F|tara:strand:+ start:773 stop:1060 length:288 start_codon:yes stop_codon:yes gene_type:complete